MGVVAQLQRTLEQELLALVQGVSMECLVCGELVTRLPDQSLLCPECGSAVRSREAGRAGLQSDVQAG